MTTPKELCMLLDYTARSDLRQATKKGYINRSQYKKKGVALLEGLELIKCVRQGSMHRYEPTELGHSVAVYLPNDDNEHEHVMLDKPLVYADGTTIPRNLVPSYSYVRDYEPVIKRVKHGQVNTPTQSHANNFTQALELLTDIQKTLHLGKSARALKPENLQQIVGLLRQVKTLVNDKD